MAIRYHRRLFRSARLKLTLFYLAILLGFGLTLTISARILAEREYQRANTAQLGQVRHMFLGFPWKDLDTEITIVRPDHALSDIQSDQVAAVRNHLNRDFAMISAFTLVVGGLLSYWFAGRALRPIEEAHDAQARFAADASHELRTPLASMKVENEVFLRQKAFTEKEAREQIESNLEEVQRLENLSTQLLALTQYERIRLQLSPVAINDVVADSVERAHAQAKHKHVSFTQHVTAAKVSGQSDSILQLLAILLDNAIKYGPRKGTVALRGTVQGSTYVLQIEDEGPGIDVEDLPHIFERLYRGDKVRNTKAGGYGLGLALAREIAKANEASVAVVRGQGAGACFEIRFTLA